MILQSFHILLISLVCIFWGLPVVMITHSTRSGAAINTEKIILSFFTGLSLISLFAAWLCLWVPLTWTLLMMGSSLPFFLSIFILRKYGYRALFKRSASTRKKNRLDVLLFTVVSIVLFLLLGSNPPSMIDTDLYHLQIVRWNHEYGTVPGLANLYLRYGFYSNWLSMISLFILPFKNENFLYLNITLGIWFLLFLMQRLSFHLQRYFDSKDSRLFSWIYLFVTILLMAEWGLFRVNASSTSYDFIAAVIILMALLLITEDLISGHFSAQANLLPLLIISASAPFFKQTSAAIIGVVFVYLLATRKSKFMFLFFTILILLFIPPFFYRNYVQTGFPLYPYTAFAWGTPDWQVPLNMTDRISRFISLGNKYFDQPLPAIDPPSSFQWMKSWFIYIPKLDKLFVVLALTGLPVFFFYARKKLRKKTGLVYIYASCWLALCLWFLLFPAPRFAYGYLLFLASFPLSFVATRFLNQNFISVSLYILTACIIFYGAGKWNKNNSIAPANTNNPEISKVTINHSIYNLPIRSSGNPDLRCSYSPLPCLYETNPYLEQRGDNLKKGFRMNNNIDSAFIINYGY